MNATNLVFSNNLNMIIIILVLELIVLAGLEVVFKKNNPSCYERNHPLYPCLNW
jgi:hypothetical protein